MRLAVGYDNEVAIAKAIGAAIPSRPIVTMGREISCWMKVTTGDMEATAVRRFKASRAIALSANSLAIFLFILPAFVLGLTKD